MPQKLYDLLERLAATKARVIRAHSNNAHWLEFTFQGIKILAGNRSIRIQLVDPQGDIDIFSNAEWYNPMVELKAGIILADLEMYVIGLEEEERQNILNDVDREKTRRKTAVATFLKGETE